MRGFRFPGGEIAMKRSNQIAGFALVISTLILFGCGGSQPAAPNPEVTPPQKQVEAAPPPSAPAEAAAPQPARIEQRKPAKEAPKAGSGKVAETAVAAPPPPAPVQAPAEPKPVTPPALIAVPQPVPVAPPAPSGTSHTPSDYSAGSTDFRSNN